MRFNLSQALPHKHQPVVALLRHTQPAVIVALLLTILPLLFLIIQPKMLAASPSAQQASLPTGGFVPIGDAVLPTNQDTLTPSLTISPDSSEPWVALIQNNRVVVSMFVTDTATWSQQGGLLNRGSANVATDPSLIFAGSNLSTPWVAWGETVDSTTQINVSSFNGTSWSLTPLLNRDPAQSGSSPVLAAGALITGSTPLPWVAWVEENTEGIAQLVVSSAQQDNRSPGGFSWQAVGTSLNLAPTRAATKPDLTFAGPGNTDPWVVWSEHGGDRPESIFAKRLAGSNWEGIGRQEGCTDEATCVLNIDATKDATGIRIAAGTLPNETTPSPWLVFSETGSDGNQAIHVMRLDPGILGDPSDDRLIPVGGAVNTQCLGNAGMSSVAMNNVNVQSATLRDASDPTDTTAVSGGNATEPDIYFVGNVPHVAWVEQTGGENRLYVCHLADARSGLERWDLDTVNGVNRTLAAASAPSLAANATTPYIAWQESLTNSTVYVAQRLPAGPAWGVNFPSVLTGVSANDEIVLRSDVGSDVARDDVTAAAESEILLRSESVTLVTAAYHSNGATNIEEVQLQLLSTEATTETVPVLLARYIISGNLVFVQDPQRPGNFFPPATPGGNTSNINTPFVTVEPSKMKIIDHGTPSAALDVQWSLIFEDTTFFENYVQAINIIHGGGQETGFFKVGTVYVGNQRYLPVILSE